MARKMQEELYAGGGGAGAGAGGGNDFGGDMGMGSSLAGPQVRAADAGQVESLLGGPDPRDMYQ